MQRQDMTKPGNVNVKKPTQVKKSNRKEEVRHW